jgi:hypothetical protein
MTHFDWFCRGCLTTIRSAPPSVSAPAIQPADGWSEEKLRKRADAAMHSARKEVGNRPDAAPDVRMRGSLICVNRSAVVPHIEYVETGPVFRRCMKTGGERS